MHNGYYLYLSTNKAHDFVIICRTKIGFNGSTQT